MIVRRHVLTVAVALLLVTAGCLGGVGLGDGDDPVDGDDEPTDEEQLPDAEDLLEDALAAESSVETVHGVQTVTWDDGEEVTTSTHEIWQRPPDGYRSELVESDEEGAFDVTVSNGTTTWVYDESQNRAVRTDLGTDLGELDAMGEEISEKLYADMNATVEGTETVADREAYVLELTADGGDAVYESATLWIDQDTHYPLKQEGETSMFADVTITVEFEEVEFDGELEDDLFTFEPPADADVVDSDEFTFERFDDPETAEGTVPFDLPDPDVPDGYALEGVTVAENLAGWTATAEYVADDGTFLSVGVAEADDEPLFDTDVEHVEVDGVEATVREFGGTTTVTWEDDGLTYTVSGDLETEDLLEIAESIVE